MRERDDDWNCHARYSQKVVLCGNEGQWCVRERERERERERR